MRVVKGNILDNIFGILHYSIKMSGQMKLVPCYHLIQVNPDVSLAVIGLLTEQQRVRDPFVHRIGLLMESSVNTTGRDWAGEDIVQVILDPSILLSWCEVKDEAALDKLFSITRTLCYTMHAKRSAL